MPRHVELCGEHPQRWSEMEILGPASSQESFLESTRTNVTNRERRSHTSDTTTQQRSYRRRSTPEQSWSLLNSNSQTQIIRRTLTNPTSQSTKQVYRDGIIKEHTRSHETGQVGLGEIAWAHGRVAKGWCSFFVCYMDVVIQC